jgi:hypothetical protein
MCNAIIFFTVHFLLALNYFKGNNNVLRIAEEHVRNLDLLSEIHFLRSGDPLHVIRQDIISCHHRHRSEFVNMKTTPYFNF